MKREPMTRDELTSMKSAVVVKEGPDATVVRFMGRFDGTWVVRCTCGYLSRRLGDTGRLDNMARKHYREAHRG